MSFNVVMINADAYIGIVAVHAREVAVQSIKESDTRRLIWSKLILPTVMRKEFIDRVVTSQENFCRFVIDVNGPNSPLVPSDLDHLDMEDLKNLPNHSHTAFYQNFSQVADNSVPAGMTPWQIRFEFAKPTVNLLLAFSPALIDEIASVFRGNGWMFWITDSGFTIAPLNLYKNLKGISDAFLTWMDIRDKPLLDVSPQFASAIMPQTDAVDISDPPSIVRVQ